jgi:hypothetical protein
LQHQLNLWQAPNVSRAPLTTPFTKEPIRAPLPQLLTVPAPPFSTTFSPASFTTTTGSTDFSGSPLSTLPTLPPLFRYCLYSNLTSLPLLPRSRLLIVPGTPDDLPRRHLPPCSTNCPRTPPSILDAHFRAHPNSTSWSLSSTLYGSLEAPLHTPTSKPSVGRG